MDSVSVISIGDRPKPNVRNVAMVRTSAQPGHSHCNQQHYGTATIHEMVKIEMGDIRYSTCLQGNLITEALTYGTHCQGSSQFYMFINKCNDPSNLPTSAASSGYWWWKRENINTAALVTIVQCNTLIVRCSRQLIGPADWVFVTLGPLRCD